MARPFTFVIHAAAEKDRVGPIIRPLIDAGVSLWIDTADVPDLGLSEHQKRRLAGYIDGNAPWRRERNRALRDATSFLFIVSAKSISNRRSQIRMELEFALGREEEFGSPCFAAALSARELRKADALVSGKQQFHTYVAKSPAGFALDARGESEILILARRLLEVSVPRRRRTAPSPYLADRSAQASELAGHFERAAAGTVTLPILTGMHDDRPDQFALIHMPEKLVPALLGAPACEYVRMHWPADTLSAPDTALAGLTREIRRHAGSPVAKICYAQPWHEHVHIRGGLESCLRLWCEAWSRLSPAELVGTIPVLDLRLDPPGRRRLWTKWRKPAADDFEARLAAACSITAAGFPGVRLAPLSRLGLVRWSCVETWLQEDCGRLAEHEVAEMHAMLQRAFAYPGMSMQQWALCAHRTLSLSLPAQR